MFEAGGRRLAFTTDSYVVRPLFFPGGDLGSLAVHGTVNDLAMSGARPLYLSAAFIIEEGLPMETLWRIVSSMRQAAQAAGVQIITGDTKVVDKGKGDNLFINTAGVGVLEHSLTIAPQSVQPGDAILVNGDLGRHGMAIMAVREGLEFESAIESDSAPLAEAVLRFGARRHRDSLPARPDPRRPGAASSTRLPKGPTSPRWSRRSSSPCAEDVRGGLRNPGTGPAACGLRRPFRRLRARARRRPRPGYPAQAPGRRRRLPHRQGHRPAHPQVLLKSTLGTQRILDMLSGEQLPRIC